MVTKIIFLENFGFKTFGSGFNHILPAKTLWERNLTWYYWPEVVYVHQTPLCGPLCPGDMSRDMCPS